MTIKADVDRGLWIRREQERLAAELKEIEARLEAYGLQGEQIPLEDKEREGRQCIARGTLSQVAIIFTADQIVSSFAFGSDLWRKIDSLCSVSVPMVEFFNPKWSNRFKDGKAFRDHARELLGDKAPAFITACLARDKEGIPKSKTVIAWNDAKEVL